MVHVRKQGCGVPKKRNCFQQSRRTLPWLTKNYVDPFLKEWALYGSKL
jgi:hypothetical protein